MTRRRRDRIMEEEETLETAQQPSSENGSDQSLIVNGDPLNTNSFSMAFASLPLPPLDPPFVDVLPEDLTLSESLMADLGFDEDFDFNLDDLLLSSEINGFTEPDGSEIQLTMPNSSRKDQIRLLVSSENDKICVDSPVSGDQNGSGVQFSPQNSVNGSSGTDDDGRLSNFEFLVSTQGSPDSSNADHDHSRSSSVHDRETVGDCSGSDTERGFWQDACKIPADSAANRNFEANHVFDETKNGTAGWLKRKKDREDTNPRAKFQKSISSDANSPSFLSAGAGEEEKKKVRLMRNRVSAQLSRQRKKRYVEELEEKVRSMQSTISELNSQVSFIMAENASLRQQLGGLYPHSGIHPRTPMAPAHYPWVPLNLQGGFGFHPGSQVPLVPIPRLKSQQPVSASKAKKSSKVILGENEGKKNQNKTKKVASVTFLGLFLFLLFLGGLGPVTNSIFGDPIARRLEFASGGFELRSGGKVFTVSESLNESDHSGGVGLYPGRTSHGNEDLEHVMIKMGRTRITESELMEKQRGSQPLSGPEGFELPWNASEPLVASLYVPRNDKLVKIDGNLILHAVLASEKATGSSGSVSGGKSEKGTVPLDKEGEKNGLAIVGNMASALAVSKTAKEAERQAHLYRSRTEHQRALASSSRDACTDTSKSASIDGPLQEWFHEGITGPLLSSGMCTEVFHFEVSPGIVPANPIANASADRPVNDSARSGQIKNRRILYPAAIPLPGSTFNATNSTGQAGHSQGDGKFQDDKSVSPSMVVSVLVDPREAGDGNEGDGKVLPKSLSRIFVVVLLDSVKYVTYSCVLPFKGTAPHLVTT